MVAIDDVRALAVSLSRSNQVLVRVRVKFRVEPVLDVWRMVGPGRVGSRVPRG
jgi:hypothetical protein